ncbi:hypothetical protein [Ferrovibrio xuzhouensis]|uniref:Uncharacterized protein n=1 Tax=Ferrovibrio xuzhouensis TaxID=1576914 RepID=A0ABV7VBW2_9PROT
MRRIIPPLAALLTLAVFSPAYAGYVGTLETPSFTVTIKNNCEEGVVSCDDVTYTGVSKKNGSRITLKGETLHTYSADGTPSRFLGYEFRSGDYVYQALEDGTLWVTKGGKDVLVEHGKWDW